MHLPIENMTRLAIISINMGCLENAYFIERARNAKPGIPVTEPTRRSEPLVPDVMPERAPTSPHTKPNPTQTPREPLKLPAPTVPNR